MPVKLPPDNPAYASVLADALFPLGQVLAKGGRMEEALRAVEEGLAYQRQVVAQATGNAKEERATLANGLQNAAVYQLHLGMRTAAMASVRESLSLLRPLASAHPDASMRQLLGSLHQLATTLDEIGSEEAFATIQETVYHCRRLYEVRPEQYRTPLINALTTLANHLSRGEHRGEALAVALKTVALARLNVLVGTPDARLTLARSLCNLGNRMGDAERLDEGLVAHQESIAIYEAEHREHPIFEPELAGGHNNLAITLLHLGRTREALRAARTSVRLYRTIASLHPRAYLVRLSTALQTLAVALREAGKPAAARRATAGANQLHQQATRDAEIVVESRLRRALAYLAEQWLPPGLTLKPRDVVAARPLATDWLQELIDPDEELMATILDAAIGVAKTSPLDSRQTLFAMTFGTVIAAKFMFKRYQGGDSERRLRPDARKFIESRVEELLAKYIVDHAPAAVPRRRRAKARRDFQLCDRINPNRRVRFDLGLLDVTNELSDAICCGILEALGQVPSSFPKDLQAMAEIVALTAASRIYFKLWRDDDGTAVIEAWASHYVDCCWEELTPTTP